MKLIARDDQIRELVAGLKEALQGRFQVVFVTGEAGIGKTTLITNFVAGTQAKRPEIFVASSRCYSIAGSQQDAYLPFVQILEQLVSTNKGDTLWDRLRSGLAEVAPEWIAIVPVIGGAAAATVRTFQWAQREFSSQGTGAGTSRLMIQYTNALKLASETAPLLLWIDDLHWSDNATLNLISFLADHARDSCIMLVVSYRPTDIVHDVQGQPHPVRRLVHRLERDNTCEQIPLSAFTRTDLEHFLESEKLNLPSAFVDRLWRQSGGNPLFVREYITLLHKRNLIHKKEEIFVLTQEEIEVVVPDTVQSVIEDRLDLIGEDLYRLLSRASVQGERFASRVLAQLLQDSELDVLERLNLLDRVHQLIREMEENHLIVKVGGEYQFIHALIQQTLYQNLKVAQRRHLHLTIAQLLENLYGEDAPQYASDLAIHFERGGDLANAVPYYLQAGHSVLAILALDDALVYAEKVRTIAQQAGDTEQSAIWQVQALLIIIETHNKKAEYEIALKNCDIGETLCQQWNLTVQYAHVLYWRSILLSKINLYLDAVEVNKKALQLLGDDPIDIKLQGYLYARMGSESLRISLSESEVQYGLGEALRIAEENGFTDIKAIVFSHKAWIAMQKKPDRQPERALEHIQIVLTIAKEQNNELRLISCYRMMAFACRHLDRDEDAFHYSQQAIKLARKYGLPRELSMTLYTLSHYWKEVKEDWQVAMQVARESILVADQYEFPVNVAVLTNLFRLSLSSGLWHEAEDIQKRYFERIKPGYTRRLGIYYDRQGQLAYARGWFTQALAHFGRALKIYETNSAEKQAKGIQPFLGLALTATGNLDQGAEYFLTASRYWKNNPKSDRNVSARYALCLQGMARFYRSRDDYEQSIAVLREALATVQGQSDFWKWPVWRHVSVDLGQALLTTGETEEALQHAMFGYQKFKKWGHFLLGEAAFVVGQILVAQGKREDALAYLHEARSDWQRLELTHHLSAWEAFMQEHGMETASG